METSQRTLSDYLATIRRRRLVIGLIVIACVGSALVASLLSEKVYEAEASIRVLDPAESLGIAGLLPAGNDTAAQRAAQAAATVTRTEVLKRALERHDLGLTLDGLRSRVEAVQETDSNLVTVTGRAGAPRDAADIANAVVKEAIINANQTARERYADFATELQKQARAAPKGSSEPGVNDPEGVPRDVLFERVGSLLALSTVAELAELADPATAPDAPISPKPVQNAVVAGVLGLLLGLLLASLLESLDRRLRKASEAQELLDLPLVGTIVDHAVGGVAVLGAPTAERVAAMDMFRMLLTNLSYLNIDESRHCVLVASSLPEEGKTTVAAGIALASAANGRRTLLVEADLHRPVLAERLGIDSEPGLADYLAGRADPADIVQVFNFNDPVAETAENGSEPAGATLACIVAGRRSRWSGAPFATARFEDFLQAVNVAYDLVVIDSAPLLAVAETLELVPAVDTVLLCTRLGQTTTEQAKAGLEALKRLPERPTGLVVTGLGDEDASSVYAYAYGYRFDSLLAEKPRRHLSLPFSNRGGD